MVEPTYYRTVGDADEYFSTQLYATDWTGAADADKAKALLMASQAVDSLKFKGVKRTVWKALRDAGGDVTKPSSAMLANTTLTDLELQTAYESQAHQFPRDNGASAESWRLIIDASNGTFTLTFDGEETAAIDFDADAATIQAALELLSTVGSGGITVAVDTDSSGVDGEGPYLITTAGDLATSEYNTLTVDPASLVGGTDTRVLTVSDNIPDDVFYAVCEEAMNLLSGRDPDQEFRNLVLTSDGVGSNRVSSDRSQMPPEHSSHFFTSPKAFKYLKRYLTPANSFNFKRVS